MWDFTDIRDPQPIEYPAVTADSSSVWFVDFYGDGGYLIGVDTGGRARLWDLDTQHTITRICEVTRSLMNRRVWEDHMLELPYDPPCE